MAAMSSSGGGVPCISAGPAAASGAESAAPATPMNERRVVRRPLMTAPRAPLA